MSCYRNAILIVFNKIHSNSIYNYNLHPFSNKNITICLVINGNINELKTPLKQLVSNLDCDVSIVNLKKKKTSLKAIKAGIRYLTNYKEFDAIIELKPETITKLEVIEKIIKTISKKLSFKKQERILLKKVYTELEILNN